MAASKILKLQIDAPLVQGAGYAFDNGDRAYIDSQILGIQQLLLQGTLSGINATYVTLDASSAAVAVGDLGCTSGLGGTVTRGTDGALAAAGGVLCIFLAAGTPGGAVLAALTGVLPPTVTGLTPGTARPVIASAGRCATTVSVTSGQFVIGTMDAAGYLTLTPVATGALPASASSAGQTIGTIANGLNSNIATGNQPTVRLTGPTAAFSIGGFSPAPAAGTVFSAVVDGTQTCTIVHEDTSSTAACRIDCGGAPVVVPIGRKVSLQFLYNGSTNRFVLQNAGFHQVESVNVADFFGAYGGDNLNVTACDAAFNAAIAAAGAMTSLGFGYGYPGGRVRVNPGKYKLTSGIRLTHGVELDGGGNMYNACAVLSPAAGVTAITVDSVNTVPGGNATSGQGATIRGLGIFAAGANVYAPWTSGDSTVVNGTIRVPNYGPLWTASTAIALDNVGTVWTAGMSVTLNELVRPPAAHANGYYYQVTNASGGVASTTEPTWPASTLVTSGTVSVTHGSPNITFSSPQTLAAGAFIVFASQPGSVYTIAAATTASTAAAITIGYTGTTNAATTTGTVTDGAGVVFTCVGIAGALRPAHDNGRWYQVTTVGGGGATGATEPSSWVQVPGQTITDNGNTYTCMGYTDRGIAYKAGGSGTTGATQPNWPQGVVDGVNATTVADNGITWTTFEMGAAIRAYQPFKIENCIISGMEGDGVRLLASVAGVPASNANIWYMASTWIQTCGGNGFYIKGSDVNAGVTILCSFVENSGAGVLDIAFLANTYLMCHSRGNGVAAYIGGAGTNSTQFYGCYAESDNPYSNIMAPAAWFGGSPCPFVMNQQTGFIFAVTNQSGPIPIQMNQATNGYAGSGQAQLGDLQTDSVLRWQYNGEANYFRLTHSDSGSNSTSHPQWLTTYNNSTGWGSLGYTGDGAREGVNRALFPRGVFVGPQTGSPTDLGTYLTSCAAAPSAAAPDGFGLNQFRVGDKYINSNPLSNGVAEWIATSRAGFTNGPWTATTNYYAGTVVTAATPEGHVFRCIGHGQSGNSQPTGMASPAVGTIYGPDGTGKLYWECFGTSTPTFSPRSAQGGRLSHNMTADANYTLVATEQLSAIVEVTDTHSPPWLSTTRNMVLPTFDGAEWTVFNNTAQSLQFITAGGTGVTVLTGKRQSLYCDGTNIQPAGAAV